ncbi:MULTISPECIES: DUF1661 domain-containing protein [Porphyromonas]|nr:DUF1661 domain-containing protein [Porphyromonas gulae]
MRERKNLRATTKKISLHISGKYRPQAENFRDVFFMVT